jgi:hypothetical protein
MLPNIYVLDELKLLLDLLVRRRSLLPLPLTSLNGTLLHGRSERSHTLAESPAQLRHAAICGVWNAIPG